MFFIAGQTILDWSETPSSALTQFIYLLLIWCFYPEKRKTDWERMQRWQMERECADKDKTKTETEARKRRRGGEEEEKKNTEDRNEVYVSGWPLRWFSISAGQRKWANMIFFSTRQQKTDGEGRESGDGKEGNRGGKKEEKGKEMSKWKKMGGKRETGWDLIGWEIKERLWEENRRGMQSIYITKSNNRPRFCLKRVRQVILTFVASLQGGSTWSHKLTHLEILLFCCVLQQARCREQCVCVCARASFPVWRVCLYMFVWESASPGRLVKPALYELCFIMTGWKAADLQLYA